MVVMSDITMRNSKIWIDTMDKGLGAFDFNPKVSAHLLLNFKSVALSCMQDMLRSDSIEVEMKLCAYINIYIL